MVITDRLTNQQLLEKIYNAAAEYEKLLGRDYLIIGKNNKSDYLWFECFFEKKNFMHLLGIESKTMSADEFFNRCSLHNKGNDIELTVSDCTPSRKHTRRTINQKISCCADLLKINNAKYMKIGRKEKIHQYVDFSYAYGNEAILGFQRETANKSCFPITLMTSKISDSVAQTYRIIFVFEKRLSDVQYSGILMERKKGILEEHYQAFPEKLKNLIDIG